MSYKVVYFTRTGTSRRIADKFATRLSCETVEITDNKNWEGIIGFVKGGYYASKNKDVDIKTNKEVDSDDELVVISPLWAGGLAPAVRAFLKTVDKDRVHLVVTSNASRIKNSGNFLSLTEIIRNGNNEETAVDTLVEELAKVII